MIDDECRDHDLEDVSRKIVMKEKRSIVEEEGDEVEEVAAEQDLADVDKFGEKFWNEIGKPCDKSYLIAKKIGLYRPY